MGFYQVPILNKFMSTKNWVCTNLGGSAVQENWSVNLKWVCSLLGIQLGLYSLKWICMVESGSAVQKSGSVNQ